jgi:hypothetical protein
MSLSVSLRTCRSRIDQNFLLILRSDSDSRSHYRDSRRLCHSMLIIVRCSLSFNGPLVDIESETAHSSYDVVLLQRKPARVADQRSLEVLSWFTRGIDVRLQFPVGGRSRSRVNKDGSSSTSPWWLGDDEPDHRTCTHGRLAYLGIHFDPHSISGKLPEWEFVLRNVGPRCDISKRHLLYFSALLNLRDQRPRPHAGS